MNAFEQVAVAIEKGPVGSGSAGEGRDGDVFAGAEGCVEGLEGRRPSVRYATAVARVARPGCNVRRVGATL